MTLKSYLRIKINNKFVPLIKKEECELCGSKINLQVHHIKPFAEILQESLIDLKLEYKENIESYSTNELNLILDLILGKHLIYKCLTVCDDCHKNIIHKSGTSNIGNGFDLWVEENRLKKEVAERENLKNTITYLQKNKNKRLYKNEKDELSKCIKLKDSRGRFKKSIGQFNKYFKEHNINYYIISKRVKEKNILKTIWIIKDFVA